MVRQQDSLVKKTFQFSLIIALTLGCGCTALPPMYRDLYSAFTLPMSKDTDSSVSHFKDQESNKIIVNSMGWDDLGKTPETQCENAYKKAEDKIYTIARKTVSQSSLKKEEHYDHENNFCVILLSVELEESDVDAQVLSQLPRQDKTRSKVFKKPRGKFITPPIYPREARVQGLEGTAVVRVTIGVTGKPTNIGISQTTGFPILDQQALITVKEWRFFPAEKNGEAISKTVDIPIQFRLSE